MNKYINQFLITQLCFIAALTLCAATAANGQTVAPPLFTVTHDATLQGDGTTGSPLSITASPTVTGSLNVTGDIQAKNIVSASSTVTGDLTVNGGIQANALVESGRITVHDVFAHHLIVDARNISFSDAIRGGFTDHSIIGRGGLGVALDSLPADGGTGVVGVGGFHEVTGTELLRQGGTGVHGFGGFGINGGVGVQGDGGNTSVPFGSGGVGVSAHGGKSSFGNGGAGVVARGSGVLDAPNVAGRGILATAGQGNLGAINGFAADFDGNVVVAGNVSKGSGSFKIDHPLDPENKYLSHSFVESPDMMNIYNGNVTTDANGDALVQLPEYFLALNRDFRYQLTVIGMFADSIVSEKITDNHFRIRTSLPNIKVSWQVTGIRQDAFANSNRIAVEQEKPESERGFYLHPEAFDQPKEKGIVMANHPEILRQAQGNVAKADKPALQQK